MDISLEIGGGLSIELTETATGSSGTPATTVTGPDIAQQPPAVGTDLPYARQSHDHGDNAIYFRAMNMV